ncbi:MAG: hypothetical protein P4L40_07290 [Terracidiphilus sp.]|nr:hypothetical protein [Terracidiphilus sp.]
MKVTAIKLARAIVFFDTGELRPTGIIALHQIGAEIAKKFGFHKLPAAEDAIDDQKGFVFETGLWNGTVVDKLTIYNDGIILDTQISTDCSLNILRESLIWANQSLGLHFDEEMLRRTRFLSTFAFHSDAPILNQSRAIVNAARTMTELMESITGTTRPYEGIRIDLSFDSRSHKEPIAPFTIQRLGTTPFDAARYFTQAPLPTDTHIEVIRRFESDVLTSVGSL